MENTKIYDELKTIQSIAWRGDDRIDQDDLFELQNTLAELILELAISLNKEKELLKEFYWLYKEES